MVLMLILAVSCGRTPVQEDTGGKVPDEAPDWGLTNAWPGGDMTLSLEDLMGMPARESSQLSVMAQ